MDAYRLARGIISYRPGTKLNIVHLAIRINQKKLRIEWVLIMS